MHRTVTINISYHTVTRKFVSIISDALKLNAAQELKACRVKMPMLETHADRQHLHSL